MGLFRRRRPEEVAPEPEETRSRLLPGGLWAPTGSSFSAPTAGEVITMQSALRSSATWACQRVLVSTISMLPVDVVRTTGAKREQVAQPPIVRNPSGRVSRRGWVAQCVRSNLSAGNIYGKVVDIDAMGRPAQIETVDPASVAWMVEAGEEVPYVNGVRQDVWPLGDFWHVPASQFLQPGSRVAMSPTEYAATSIGTSLAAERFASNWMELGRHPSSIYYVDAEIDRDQALAIKQTIMDTTRTGEPGVLGSSIKRESVMPNMTDSRFIDLLRFEVEQACRFWGVPPSMVYAAVSGQNVTYSNITQNDLQFLKYSVEAWIVDLEDAWSDLIAIPRSVKFNVDALLRMDAKARAELAKLRLDAKTTTVNAVRALEDEEPFPDPIYDQPGIPAAPSAPAASTDPVQQELPLGGA